jgi:ribosomal protein S20
MKKVKHLVDLKDRENASNQLRVVDKALGKAVNKGILKSNTASRWMSRLSSSVNRIASSS